MHNGSQEGPSHDRGLYYRASEELFDLVNSEATPTSETSFFVTMFELYNDQVWSQLLRILLDIDDFLAYRSLMGRFVRIKH